MRGVNKVILIGNLGRDPDIQYIEGNIAVSKFSLATTETFKDRSGKQLSQTEWHTVVLWRGLAELSQKYLHKGSLVYIEGRLRTRTWEDKDHNKKHATEVVADNLVMLDKRSDYNLDSLHEGHHLDHDLHEVSHHPGGDAQPDHPAEGSEGAAGTQKQNPANDDLPF